MILKTRNTPTLFILVPAILIMFTFLLVSEAKAQTSQTFAVLPFTIHADQNMDYVKKGISRMLYSRLTWPGKVAVIPPEKLDKVLKTVDDLSGYDRVHTIAKKTHSLYVLSGAITRFDGSFSLDAKLFDIENKRYMAFSQQSENTDDLIRKVDRLAATINHRVFKRTTLTWEDMEQEKQKQINDLKRQNPERLMPVPETWQTEEEIGWKVWKYIF